jgi:hypothetical protein
MEKQLDVEILVHIGAPSRAVDDARYRSLAAAYLAFKPAETTHILSRSGSRDSSQDGGHVSDTQASQPQAAEDGETSFMQSNEWVGSFQSLQASFRSVVDNAGSPQMRIGGAKMPDHALLEQTPVPATQASWQTPPSVVQDSHFSMNHADFTSLTSPTRVLENYLQHFESPPASSQRDSQTSDGPVSRKIASPIASDRLYAGNMVPCTPHIFPRARYALESPSDGRAVSAYEIRRSDRQQQLEAQPDERSDDNIIEETKLLSSSLSSEISRADSEPPPKLRQLDLLVSTPRPLARATSDMGPRSSSKHKAPVTITFLSSHGFTYESLEIRPPEPPTAELHIKPHQLTTPGLHNLALDVDLSSRFRPKEQTRQLRPYERGHWVLDCSSWEPQLKRDTWAFLANYVGTGIAGWGVWCKRDPDFRELRAYCWGSVVAHIYYVLWLSSQRKIVSTDSSWIDADGGKVIVMGARDHPQR